MSIPKYTVADATEEEWRNILAEPQIAARLCASWQGEVPDFSTNSKLLRYGKYRMLFTARRMSDTLYETHIAVPLDSLRASRVLALLGVQWCFSGALGAAKVLVTTVPRGKIENFAKKVGWRKAYVLGKPMYVIYKEDLEDIN